MGKPDIQPAAILNHIGEIPEPLQIPSGSMESPYRPRPKCSIVCRQETESAIPSSSPFSLIRSALKEDDILVPGRLQRPNIHDLDRAKRRHMRGKAGNRRTDVHMPPRLILVDQGCNQQVLMKVLPPAPSPPVRFYPTGSACTGAICPPAFLNLRLSERYCGRCR